ncbi:hypothetical protein DMH02_003835 [Streptomyces sp. WAC 00631]|uniref:hypothetical protein n=1 Tax=unclassified Streptomyces TaxID=2593676 RepID=UPI00163C08A4|nr:MULTISPECIES: hypothetical protein [unclassified Streptomyces]MCC5032403.1 hypothetical protein [Streptomyces sp. WAC 00631]MCC9740513.1 hypothetical protein [Streptomyces sp. MNU89]
MASPAVGDGPHGITVEAAAVYDDAVAVLDLREREARPARPARAPGPGTPPGPPGGPGDRTRRL